jgi:hypothetical protein
MLEIDRAGEEAGNAKVGEISVTPCQILAIRVTLHSNP